MQDVFGGEPLGHWALSEEVELQRNHSKGLSRSHGCLALGGGGLDRVVLH